MQIFNTLDFSGVQFDGFQRIPNQNATSQQFANFNINCHQSVRHVVPDVAAYICNYVAAKAPTNLPRSVHWNMICSSSAHEITVLTTLVVNLATMRLSQQQFQNIDQALKSVIIWAIDSRVNFIAVNHETLKQSVGNSLQAVQRSASEYVGVCNEVENFMANVYSGRTVSANQGFQGGLNNGGEMTGFGSTGIATGFGSSGGSSMSGFGTSGSQSNNPIVTVGANENNNQRSDRFGRDLTQEISEVRVIKREEEKPRQVIRDVMVDEPRAKQQTISVKDAYDENGKLITKNLPDTNLPWKPSILQSYPPAYDSSRFKLVKKLAPLKDGTFAVINLCQTKEIMDRTAHALPTAQHFLQKIVPDNLGAAKIESREQFKNESLKQMTEKIKLIRDQPTESAYVEQLEEFRKNGFLVLNGEPCNSITEAISIGRQGALMNNAEQYGAYNVEFVLAEEFILYEKDAAVFAELSRYDNFRSLASKMRGYIEDDLAPQSLRTAVVQLNAYLGKKFVEFLEFYICCDNYTSLDSFIDDVFDVIDDVGASMGDMFKELLLHNQKRFLDIYMSFSKPTDSVLGADNGKHQIKVVSAETPSSITFVEFLASEFNFELPENTSGFFGRSTLSDSVSNSMVEQIMNAKSQSLGQLRRFFMVTIDNVIYEVNIGLSEHDAPTLIRKLK